MTMSVSNNAQEQKQYDEFIDGISNVVSDALIYQLRTGGQEMLEVYNRNRERFIDVYLEYVKKDLIKGIIDKIDERLMKKDVEMSTEQKLNERNIHEDRVSSDLNAGLLVTQHFKTMDSAMHSQDLGETERYHCRLPFINTEGKLTGVQLDMDNSHTNLVGFNPVKDFDEAAKLYITNDPSGREPEDGSFAIIDKMQPNQNLIQPMKVLEEADEILICRDYPSAVSLSAATNRPVVMAATVNNTMEAAFALRDRFPDKKICLCTNGERRLNAVAREIDGEALTPQLSDTDKANGLNSFFDLHSRHGMEALQKCLEGHILQNEKNLAPEQSQEAELGR